KSHGYVVLNAGTVGANATMERERLQYELTHGQKPAILIIMDGGLGTPGRTFAESRGRVAEPPLPSSQYLLGAAPLAIGTGRAVRVEEAAGQYPGAGRCRETDQGYGRLLSRQRDRHGKDGEGGGGALHRSPRAQPLCLQLLAPDR